MVEISSIYDKDENVIGLMFDYSEQKEKTGGKFSKISVINGEIKRAESSDSYTHNIYDYDNPFWDGVEVALKIFYEKEPKVFSIIVSKLQEGNMSYAVATKIINAEVNKLEEQVKTLKLLINR